MGVWVCKEEKRILEELGRGTTFRIYYIKNDYSIKKKKPQEKETRKISEQYGSMHIRTKHCRSKTEGK